MNLQEQMKISMNALKASQEAQQRLPKEVAELQESVALLNKAVLAILKSLPEEQAERIKNIASGQD